MKRLFFGLASWFVSAVALTDPGRKVVDKLFWNWVFDLFGPLVPAVEDFAIPVAFFGLGVYLWTREGTGATLLQKVRSRLNPYFTIAALGALVVVGALIGAWLDHRRGPIDWVISTGSPIAFSQSTDGPLLVTSFNMLGNNRTDYPVPLGESFIRSDITNQMLRFRIGVPGGDIQTTEATVEPKGSVILVADYPLPEAQRSGITVERFRSEFGRFTFSISYADGRKFERSFSAGDVNELINAAAKHHAQLLQRTPGVIRNRN